MLFYLGADNFFPLEVVHHYNDSARYVKSERGAQILLFSNFIYRQHTKANKDGYKTWYCNMYHSKYCTSVLTTDSEDHIVTIRGSHNHPVPRSSTTADGVLHMLDNKKRGRKKKIPVANHVKDKDNSKDDVEYLP